MKRFLRFIPKIDEETVRGEEAIRLYYKLRLQRQLRLTQYLSELVSSIEKDKITLQDAIKSFNLSAAMIRLDTERILQHLREIKED